MEENAFAGQERDGNSLETTKQGGGSGGLSANRPAILYENGGYRKEKKRGRAIRNLTLQEPGSAPVWRPSAAGNLRRLR
jgi:hypothetical protein